MLVKKVEPLHHQVYHIIKKLIIEGEYQPGERIVELKLAERLGTSRGPVREAIRMLVQDGLLVENENMLVIYNPDADAILELYQCRQALESLAAKLATQHMTPDILEQLEANIQATRQALQQESLQDISNLDQQFHDIIAMTSNNQQLIQLYELIKTKNIYIRSNIIRNYYKNFLNFVDEHQLIYEALKKGDPAEAEEAMRQHIQKNLEASYTLIKHD